MEAGHGALWRHEGFNKYEMAMTNDTKIGRIRCHILGRVLVERNTYHSLCVKDRDSHADSESVDQVVDVNPMPKLKDGEVPVENWIVDGKSYEKWIKNGINSSTWYPF